MITEFQLLDLSSGKLSFGTQVARNDERRFSDCCSDGDPIFCSHDDAPVDRALMALTMHNASEMCVHFCDDFGVLNDLYLWLLYENAIAYCSMRSKGSKWPAPSCRLSTLDVN
jgi:hypothetical protein